MSIRTTSVLLGLITTFSASTRAQCPSGSAALTPPGADASIRDAVVFDDGSGPALYVAGTFTNVGGTPALRVARWYGDAFSGSGWSAVGGGLPVQEGSSGVVLDLAVLDLGDGPHLYAAGSMEPGWYYPGGFVARWTGTAWESLGIVGVQVRTIAAYEVGGVPRLFAGGVHIDIHENLLPMLGQRVNGLWSLVPNAPMTIAVHPLFPSWYENGSIDALAVHDDGSGPKLYAGGRFHRVLGTWCMSLASWDGSQWAPLGNGIGTSESWITELSVHDDGSGAALYMNERATGTSCVKRWTGSGFESVGGAFPGWVGSFASAGPMLGRPAGLWAFGAFGTPASQAGIAFYDGSSWSVENLPFGVTVTHSPSAITPYEEGGTSRMFAVGNFGHGAPWVQHVLRYDGTSFSAVVGCTEVGETFCQGDGLEAGCPCGNDSAVGSRAGCLNSLGLGATLRAEGRASLSGDTLLLRGAQMPNSSALYFQAGARHAPVSFGDGLKCTGGPFVRLGTAQNVAQSSTYPGAGQAPISERGPIGAPGTRHYQARYRNAAAYCTELTFNYTNGVTIVWGL